MTDEIERYEVMIDEIERLKNQNNALQEHNRRLVKELQKIVRCKDCERYGRGSCPRFEDFMSNYLKDDDFCSDGVAKMKGGAE